MHAFQIEDLNSEALDCFPKENHALTKKTKKNPRITFLMPSKNKG